MLLDSLLANCECKNTLSVGRFEREIFQSQRGALNTTPLQKSHRYKGFKTAHCTSSWGQYNLQSNVYSSLPYESISVILNKKNKEKSSQVRVRTKCIKFCTLVSVKNILNTCLESKFIIFGRLYTNFHH